MTIDERLEFLLQSTESLHATTQQQSSEISDLLELTRVQEQRWEKFRQVARAALAAFLDGDGNDEENPQP